MSEWINPDSNFDGSLTEIEDLLRLAADELPPVRSGLRAEIITRAQKAQREVRFQHMLWGAVTTLFLFAGALVWKPASPGSALASNENSSPKSAKASLHITSDWVDWELVESKNQLRRRNLEILRNAF